MTSLHTVCDKAGDFEPLQGRDPDAGPAPVAHPAPAEPHGLRVAGPRLSLDRPARSGPLATHTTPLVTHEEARGGGDGAAGGNGRSHACRADADVSIGSVRSER